MRLKTSAAGVSKPCLCDKRRTGKRKLKCIYRRRGNPDIGAGIFARGLCLPSDNKNEQ